MFIKKKYFHHTRSATCTCVISLLACCSGVLAHGAANPFRNRTRPIGVKSKIYIYFLTGVRNVSCTGCFHAFMLGEKSGHENISASPSLPRFYSQILFQLLPFPPTNSSRDFVDPPARILFQLLYFWSENIRLYTAFCSLTYLIYLLVQHGLQIHYNTLQCLPPVG
jgi:hypothetical protein